MNAIHYRLCARSPSAHLFEVSCRIEAPARAGQRVSLPAWIPGSYMIRDFAKNVVTLQARCGGEPVTVTKQDKDSWLCAPCDGPLLIEYQVYAWDLSVRAAHLDQGHGYCNGTSVFLRVHGQEQAPCVVDIQPPAEAVAGPWRVGTGLPRLDAPPYGFGTYQALDYDHLIDCPIEMADFSLATFEVAGVNHDLIISGRHQADLARLSRDLQRVCEAEVALWGELPAMERYVFMVLVVGSGYGGLEHRNSTSLLCSRNDLPLRHEDEVKEGYRSFLGLCSHEYFHTWNVKRIKPAAFLPYDLSRENYTRQLWFFEGFTAYYDDLLLVRSGLITPQDYLQLLGETITRVYRGAGRRLQPVAESSFDAWTKFYKQDENSPNAIVSYYTQGSLIALGLDSLLRQRSGGRVTLDDLMRRLWQEYGRPYMGVPEGRIEQLCAELAGSDLGGFFANYVHGTADYPLDQWLQALGVALHWRAASGKSDKGGKPANGTPRTLPNLGAKYESAPMGVRLTQVYHGEPAQQAGLSAGDVVIALDGLQVSADGLDSTLLGYDVGATVELHGFRRDELRVFTLRLGEPAHNVAYLTLAEDPAAGPKWQGWLRPATE